MKKSCTHILTANDGLYTYLTFINFHSLVHDILFWT